MSGDPIEVAIDIGSASIKAVATAGDRNIVAQLYRPIRGQLNASIRAVLNQLADINPPDRCLVKALTGIDTDTLPEERSPVITQARSSQRLPIWFRHVHRLRSFGLLLLWHHLHSPCRLS